MVHRANLAIQTFSNLPLVSHIESFYNVFMLISTTNPIDTLNLTNEQKSWKQMAIKYYKTSKLGGYPCLVLSCMCCLNITLSS